MKPCFARLFRDVAKTMHPDDTIESLNAELRNAYNSQNLLEESRVAKKMSIINALEGLYLYIPCKIRLMMEAQKSTPNEIFQDLIQTLSLIYFIEGVFSQADVAWLAQQKANCGNMLLTLPVSTQEFMQEEAHQAAEALIHSYTH